MPDIDYPTGIPDLPLDRVPDVVFEGDTAADFERLCRNVVALCRVVGLPASTDSTGGAAPATGHEGRIAQIAESLAALNDVGGAASLAALVGPLEGDDPATLAGRLNLLRDSLDALPTTAATDALGNRIDGLLSELTGDEGRVTALEARLVALAPGLVIAADAPGSYGPLAVTRAHSSLYLRAGSLPTTVAKAGGPSVALVPGGPPQALVLIPGDRIAVTVTGQSGSSTVFGN